MGCQDLSGVKRASTSGATQHSGSTPVGGVLGEGSGLGSKHPSCMMRVWVGVGEGKDNIQGN